MVDSLWLRSRSMLDAARANEEKRAKDAETEKAKAAVYDQQVLQLRSFDALQARELYLNETTKDRMRAMNAMLGLLVTLLLCVVLLYWVHAALPWLLPTNLYLFLEVILVGVFGIRLYAQYRDYQRRDPVRFDRLSIADPPDAGSDVAVSDARKIAAATAAAAGDLITSAQAATCTGSQCCEGQPGVVFDPKVGRCVVKVSTTT